MISEKPDAARRISEALAEGHVSSVGVDGVPVFTFSHRGEPYVVCAAQGHLYVVSDTIQERSVYPVFDVEWFPADAVGEEHAYAGPRISAIKKLARGASRFINACDYDAEGETIGFNLLRYACGREAEAVRARFSTLTKDDLVRAFDATAPQGASLAAAGRLRHLADFAWGVNLTRALSQSPLTLGRRYRTVSIGRVQGPTLEFVAGREREIGTFVPRPYWKVDATFEKGGKAFRAGYSEERIGTKAEADRIVAECEGSEGVVERVERSLATLPPPPPFNTGDLQKEAFAAFGYSPSRTLQMAERLYLDALISYPRTDSQKIPASVGYERVMRGLARSAEYRVGASELLRSGLNPVQGYKSDAAHPAIYPTGELPRRRLDRSGAALYDLVVRRFLSAFAPPARRESVRMAISLRGHQFSAVGRRTVSEGWLRYYGRYARVRDEEVPEAVVGERLKTAGLGCVERFEARPPRYSQSSLLQKMEDEGIGTKATRADTISTLVSRGYVVGEPLAATDLGLSVVELMERYAPDIVSTDLTRSIEGRLARIESGEEDGKEFLRGMFATISKQLAGLKAREAEVGRDIDRAALSAAAAADLLGRCPVCRSGMLKVVRSRKTKKRFVGCTNYGQGCRASAPLPQRGTIRVAEKPCSACSWPVVYVTAGGRPWKLCVNMECPSRKVKRSEVQAV